MAKTVLQIPMPKTLRTKAEKTASDLGFSSLQEMVRAFLNKLAKETVEISFRDKSTVQLSAKAIARYNKMIEDVEKDKNIHQAKNAQDLIKQLDQ